MPIDSGNLALKGLDDLFSTEENRQEEQREQVQQIPIDALHPFTNHPFKVLDDEAMTRTVESIAQYGVLAPLIARPRPDGDGYEIISGHRRSSNAASTPSKSASALAPSARPVSSLVSAYRRSRPSMNVLKSLSAMVSPSSPTAASSIPVIWPKLSLPAATSS